MSQHSQLLETLVASFMETKKELCEENIGPADITPLIIGSDINGKGFVLPDTLEDSPTDNLPLLLSALVNELQDLNNTLAWNWVAYIAEGYEKASGLPSDFRRGAFEKEYRTNPASDVKEVLLVSLFTWEGVDTCGSVSYHYGDDGMPVWSEQRECELTSEQGVIPFTFGTFRKYCKHEGDLNVLMAK
jgi:hypothetical protein